MKTLHYSIIAILFVTVFSSSGIALAQNIPVALTQYPLKQFRMGTFVQDVYCFTGFQLFFKAEDHTPACLQPETATVLIQRGWAIAHLPESFVEKIAIKGLQQNYTVGQTINATVNYTGYMNGGLYPDVKILNVDNGSKVWSNCLYTHTELPSGGGIGTATYNVQCFDKYPVINETGNYIMIASVDNDTTSVKFTVVKPLMSNKIIGLENDAGVVTLGNQTYYFETPRYIQNAWIAHPVQISFHDVVFALFPSVYRGGLPIPCSAQGSDQYYWTDAKFADGTNELLHILVDDPPCTNSIPSMFSNHTNPQAGLTFYDGKMKLLVSTDNQVSQKENTTLSASFEPCDTPYPQSNTGGVAVLYMPVNSLGKICVQYSNLNNDTTGIGIRVFEADNLTQDAPEITTWSSENSIQGNATIVYTIKTGDKAGFYGLSLFCGGIPLAVGYDINSTIVANDFPWVGKTFECPAQTYEYHVDSTKGIGVRYMPYSGLP